MGDNYQSIAVWDNLEDEYLELLAMEQALRVMESGPPPRGAPAEQKMVRIRALHPPAVHTE